MGSPVEFTVTVTSAAGCSSGFVLLELYFCKSERIEIAMNAIKNKRTKPFE
jgi:hypothetical protein